MMVRIKKNMTRKDVLTNYSFYFIIKCKKLL